MTNKTLVSLEISKDNQSLIMSWKKKGRLSNQTHLLNPTEINTKSHSPN